MPSFKKKSIAQEDRLAKVFAGKRVPASGAKWYCKGDVKCANFLIEAKFTEGGKYKFSMGVWNKIKREAIEQGKIPLICVGLRGEGIGVKRNYVIFKLLDLIMEFPFNDICHSPEYRVNKVANLDVDFIINNTPFFIKTGVDTLVMMKERDFLDKLGLV